MAGAYVFIVEGLDDISYERDKDRIDQMAARAVNDAADFARTRSSTLMRQQVNFPASYLQGQRSRLNVTQRASKSNPEAVITGRQRPTSLARFATSTKKSRQGVRVVVKPGRSQLIPNSFLMPLKSGNEPGGNLGLAVRVKRGQSPRGAFKPTRINDRLWLLYGPSVDQVFKTVREDVAPDTAARMQQEFLRLMGGNFG